MLYGKKDFLERVQIIGLTKGISSSLSVYREEDYRLNISKKTETQLEKDVIQKEAYSGIVWDLTVKNHNFMIRRNGKCHFTGNCWVRKYADSHPELEGVIELPKMLHLAKRGIKWLKYNDIYKVCNHLYATHGCYVNKYHATKHLEEFTCFNIIYGHTHRPQTFSKLIHNKPHKAWGIGSLQDPKHAGYLNGMPHNWIQEFCIVDVSKRFFQVTPITLVSNQFIVDGKLWS